MTESAEPFRSRLPDDRVSWSVWRLGTWGDGDQPITFANLQLPTDATTIDQFLRRRTADSGPVETGIVVGAVTELLEMLGPTIVVAHSNSGQYVWQLPQDNVAAIIAYEPGCFACPDDDTPDNVPTNLAAVASVTRPIPLTSERFRQLCRTPIQLVYGDNIGEHPSSDFGVELWRVNIRRAQQFVAALHARGGDVEFLRLPELGISGNTHFPFSDPNNDQVASLAERFLAERGLA